jgi:hypothetical protein
MRIESYGSRYLDAVKSLWHWTWTPVFDAIDMY